MSAVNAETISDVDDDGPKTPGTDAVVDELRETFNEWIDVWDDNRTQYLADMKFVWVKGSQWDDTVKQKRKQLKMPVLEMNQLPQFVKQVTNDQRQNRPSIRVRPVRSNADDDGAELRSDLIRGIEYESNAAAAYDTAFECATTGGFGFWQIVTQYDGDGFDQVLRIKRIANPLAVVIDPYYQEADASDMMGAFVFEEIPRDEFKRRWPGKKLVAFEDASKDASLSKWFGENTVTVATAYRVEIAERKKYRLKVRDPQTGNMIERFGDELPGPPPAELIDKTRSVETRTCMVYTISGVEELEPAVPFPSAGKGYVPLVPVMGDETDVEGARLVQGLIRRAKDPQMLANFWMSVAVERAGMTPKAPYVGYKGQFKDPKWKSANERNWPYLEADMVEVDGKAAPLPQRQSLDIETSGIMEMAASFTQLLRSTIGLYDPSLGNKSNETSGKAIIAREKQGDTSTYHFIDNLSRSICYTGRILLDAIPVVYDTQRILRLVGEDGQEHFETVNQPTVSTPDNPSGLMNPIKGDDGYDCIVDTGPSYATKRTEAVEAMSEFRAQDPNVAPLMDDLMVSQMDWPLARQLAARLRSRVPPDILAAEAQKDPKTAMAILPFQQQLQGAQQQVQQMTAAMQQLQQQNQSLQLSEQAKIAKAQADAQEAQQKTVRAQAETQAEVQKAGAETQAKMAESTSRQEVALTERFEKKIDLLIAMMNLTAKQNAQTVAQETTSLGPAASAAVDAAAT